MQEALRRIKMLSCQTKSKLKSIQVPAPELDNEDMIGGDDMVNYDGWQYSPAVVIS